MLNTESARWANDLTRSFLDNFVDKMDRNPTGYERRDMDNAALAIASICESKRGARVYNALSEMRLHKRAYRWPNLHDALEKEWNEWLDDEMTKYDE